MFETSIFNSTVDVKTSTGARFSSLQQQKKIEQPVVVEELKLDDALKLVEPYTNFNALRNPIYARSNEIGQKALIGFIILYYTTNLNCKTRGEIKRILNNEKKKKKLEYFTKDKKRTSEIHFGRAQLLLHVLVDGLKLNSSKILSYSYYVYNKNMREKNFKLIRDSIDSFINEQKIEDMEIENFLYLRKH